MIAITRCLFLASLPLIIFSLSACAQTENGKQVSGSSTIKTNEFVQFARDSIVTKLKNKIANSEPLIVHVFVPLCDNEHQGIVKVGGKLGDGRSLKTNLYWGAGYGLKTWFSRSKEWKLLKNYYNMDSAVLERVVYSRNYSNKARVYLILDGYAGDKMEECLTTFFKSLAGIVKETIVLDSSKVEAFGYSDFLIFNGHNGMMDKEYPMYYTRDNIERDAAVIACASWYYFPDRFEFLKAYPLITTMDLLPPEAYVVSAVIDNWAAMQSDEKIRVSAGEAMAKVHKIAIKPCVKMFHTGW